MMSIFNISLQATDNTIFDGLYKVFITLHQGQHITYTLCDGNISLLYGLPPQAMQSALADWRNANPEKWERYRLSQTFTSTNPISNGVSLRQEYLNMTQQSFSENHVNVFV